jgi:ABC-type Fe3+-hydroxamate transport system substrate-binding protein
MTETLLSFGLGKFLVGVTKYCPTSEAIAERVMRVGGTKDPHVEGVLALKPDLVIANREENAYAPIKFLADRGLVIWVTFPTTVKQAIEDLWMVARIFDRHLEEAQRLTRLENTLRQSRQAEIASRRRYFCPIWHVENEEQGIYWVTFNGQTYAHDVLKICGGINIFATRERRYPLAADLGERSSEETAGRDVRYPRVSPREVVLGSPELILLPSEPFPFGQKHADRIGEILAETPAAKHREIYPIDGRLIAWHGLRIRSALNTLPGYFLR